MTKKPWIQTPPPKKTYDYSDYTVAWICALSLEMAAAQAMLDESHPSLQAKRNDNNTYLLGKIHDHYVVISCLPSGIYGTTAATMVAAQLRSTFESIRFFLMVGIGGGAPSKENDIRLGDIVVSRPINKSPGVIQYDYGKSMNNGRFKQTGVLDKPPPVLLSAISALQARHMLEPSKIPSFISKITNGDYTMGKSFIRPDESQDLLFETDYDHLDSEATCDNCDQGRLISRKTRAGSHPVIHYGLIASGNQVIKNSHFRDKLAQVYGIICFEMEAAGLMDYFPSLVIRGICDYSDSHKNKQWQNYAAAAAAAYAKELLSVVHANEVANMPPPEWDTVSHCRSRTPCPIGGSTSNTLYEDGGNFLGQTPLSSAVEHGHYATKNGAPIESRDTHGSRTPSKLAIRNYENELIELLLKYEAKVNYKDIDTPALLVWATQNGHTEIVKLLLQSDLSYNFYEILSLAMKNRQHDIADFLLTQSEGYDKHNLLLSAVGNNHPTLLKLLLEHHMDYDTQWSILSWSVETNNLTLLKVLIENDILYGTKLLFSAIVSEECAIAKLLLENGAPPNSRDEGGDTPLHWAIRTKNLVLIKLLLENNANPNLEDIEGDTPLHWVVKWPSRELAELLLQRNANPNIPDKEGNSPLHWAVKAKNWILMSSLFQNNADPNIQNRNGDTPLHWAVRTKDLALTDSLLEAGADPNIQNAEEDTSLHWAIDTLSPALVGLLLKRNANPNIPDKVGDTSLHRAVRSLHPALVESLLQKKADPKAENKQGISPLYWVTQGQHSALKSLLQKPRP